MKRLVLATLLVVVLGFATVANAYLQDLGHDGLIYDNVTHLTWYDAPPVYYQPWDKAVDWINSLNAQNYGGYHDWRLPSSLNQDGTGPCSGDNCTGSEMGYLFYIDLGYTANPSYSPIGQTLPNAWFKNLLAYGYWSGTESDPNHAWDFYFGYGTQMLLSKTGFGSYALAVCEDVGVPSSVPEPTTMLLLGSGLIGLAGYGRRKLLKK
jgi:hypothetical protein